MIVIDPRERVKDIEDCKKALEGEKSDTYKTPQNEMEKNRLREHLAQLTGELESPDRIKMSYERPPNSQRRVAYAWIHPQMIIYSLFGWPNRPKEEKDKFWRESGEILDEIISSGNTLLLYASAFDSGEPLPSEIEKKLDAIPNGRKLYIHKKIGDGVLGILSDYDGIPEFLGDDVDLILFGGKVFGCLGHNVDIFRKILPEAGIYLSDKATYY